MADTQSLLKRLMLLPLVLVLTAYCHVLLLDTLPGNPESWLQADTGYAVESHTFPSIFQHFISILQLDFGQSYFQGDSVTHLISKSLPYTLFLTLGCFIGLYPLAILLSIGLSLEHRYSHTLHQSLVILASIPSCLMYTLLSILSAYRWFSLCPYTFAISLLILRRIASLASLSRRYIEQEKRKKYVKAARYRNIPKTTLYLHYILKNGLRPLWIRIPKHFCHVLFSGTLMAEVLFSIPGFGHLSFVALKSQDYPLILGCLLTACFSISLAYTLGDLLQGFRS